MGDEARACAGYGDGGAAVLLLRRCRRAEEAKEARRKMWRWWGLTDVRGGFNCRAQARRGLAGQAVSDAWRHAAVKH